MDLATAGDFEPAATANFALEIARDSDILGREIGLDLSASLDKDVLARLDRSARVALDADAALGTVAPVEEVIWADHAFGDRASALRGLGGRRGCSLLHHRCRNWRRVLKHRGHRRAGRRRAEVGARHGLL